MYCILRKCAILSGVSRTINTNLRRSFKITFAVIVTKLLVYPVAIEDSEFIEQGATSIPFVLNDPLEIDALKSLM